MRNAARRNYTLDVAITAGGDVGPTPGATGDALVPGTDDHAIGEIACDMGGGQPAGSCPFGVHLQGGGSAIVTVTKADGRSRAILFDDGTATGYGPSEADPCEFGASREADLTIVRIG